MKNLFHYVTLLGVFGFIFFDIACTSPSSQKNDGGTQDKVQQTEKECTLASQCLCSQICTENACEEIKCQKTMDCRCNWKCVNGRCYDPVKAPCEANSDCTEGNLWKCDNGKCIDGGCRKDSDCKDTPKTSHCNIQTHTCEKEKCIKNGDCLDESLPLCDTKTGDCKADDGIEKNGDCSKKQCKLKLVCHDQDGKKVCRSQCKPFDTSVICEPPLECIKTSDSAMGGLCLELGKGLKEGEDCSDGKQCQQHLRCAFFAGKEICRRLCLTTDNCLNSKEECRSYQTEKLCLPPLEPCGPGRSCQGAIEGWENCENNQCKLLLCPTQRACPGTHKCNKNGRCIPRNCPTDKCPTFHECKNNRCIRTNEGFRCGIDQKIAADKCGDGLVCTNVGYITACARSCDNKSCPTDFECQTNQNNKKICLQKCLSNNCKYSDYFCYQLKRKPQGRFCVPVGQPTGKDLLETCDTQKTCLPDLHCYRGYNSKQGYCSIACTQQSDCAGLSNAVCANYYDGQKCYYKCSSYGTCMINGTVKGRCSKSRDGHYICRPSY